MIFTHVRGLYNAPLGFAAKVVRGILENEARMEDWKKDIKTMADRIKYILGTYRTRKSCKRFHHRLYSLSTPFQIPSLPTPFPLGDLERRPRLLGAHDLADGDVLLHRTGQSPVRVPQEGEAHLHLPEWKAQYLGSGGEKPREAGTWAPRSSVNQSMTNALQLILYPYYS